MQGFSKESQQFVLNDYDYYLANVSKIVKVQAFVRTWLIQKRISAINSEFSKVVKLLNPGYSTSWTRPLHFIVSNSQKSAFPLPAILSREPSPVAIVVPEKLFADQYSQAEISVTDYSIQCNISPPVYQSDACVQSVSIETEDVQLQCDIAQESVRKQTEISEAQTQTSPVIVQKSEPVKQAATKVQSPSPCKANVTSGLKSGIDKLIELHSSDFSTWSRADLEKTRTELLMELCWTDQAIESRREFLAFSRKNVNVPGDVKTKNHGKVLAAI